MEYHPVSYNAISSPRRNISEPVTVSFARSFTGEESFVWVGFFVCNATTNSSASTYTLVGICSIFHVNVLVHGSNDAFPAGVDSALSSHARSPYHPALS